MGNAYYEGKEAGRLDAYNEIKGRINGLLSAELGRVAILTDLNKPGSITGYWKGYQKGLMDLLDDIHEGEKLFGTKKEERKEEKKQC
jgi:hypothetical protein